MQSRTQLVPSVTPVSMLPESSNTPKDTQPLATFQGAVLLVTLLDTNSQYTICCQYMSNADLATSMMV